MAPANNKREHRMNRPVPVLNGDQTIEDWKRILSKLTVGVAVFALSTCGLCGVRATAC
jgi:hypothetical protein